MAGPKRDGVAGPKRYGVAGPGPSFEVRKLRLRMRIASDLYAYPEFVYLALFASVSGAFTSYRVVSTRIRIRNSIVSVSALC